MSSSGATTVQRPRRRRSDKRLWTLRVLFDGREVCTAGPRPLPPGRLVLGRAVLEGWGHTEDPLLSREHLALTLSGDQLTAEDLGSKNGSACNGRRLTTCELDSGDVLRIGDTFVVVRQVSAALRPAPARGALEQLTGDAPVMHRVRGELTRLGRRDTMVLLHGESGAGKGVTADALHRLSGRGGPFVSVNCAAIPEQLAESSLFGHERGAFSGADRPHRGFFREADGGTLFLDEVADLPAALQPKLLHAVEAGEVTPVGSARPVKVDVRIVSATSLDLEAAVASGRFRGELRARLAEYVLTLPPLRERVEDVLPLLAAHVRTPLHPDLVELLLAYRWPYNVRELVKLAAELDVRGADEAELGPELLDGRLAVAPPPPEVEVVAGPPEQDAVEAALRAAQGSVAAAARHLGRSRRQLYRDLERLGLDPADFRSR